MADISKIKLPDNSVVNIKDARIPGIDSTPTPDSANLVTSGGVNSALGGYLPLSGGAMTGPLTWSSTAALPSTTSPNYFLVTDSFSEGGTTKYSTQTTVQTLLGINNCIKYTQFGSTSAGTHYLIQFNNTNAWRGMFTVKIYDSYHFDVIEISGYNYGNQTGWYMPRARVITSSRRDTVPITFGYTSAQELWVAIATHVTSSGQARSVSVQCYNGNYLNIATNVTISLINGEENLPGTIQETNNYLNVLYPNTGVTLTTNQTISGTKTFSSGELIISTETSGTPTLTFLRGTESDGYVDHKIISDAGAFQFVRSTSGTDVVQADFVTSAFRPQGTVTSNISNITLGDSTHYWSEVYAQKYYVGSTGAYVGSSAASNIYLMNSSGAPLIAEGLVVRRGSSVPTTTLGSTTYPWGGVFSTDGDFTGDVTVGGDVTVTGNVVAANVPTYYSGTTDPDVSLGNDGDIYLKISS